MAQPFNKVRHVFARALVLVAALWFGASSAAAQVGPNADNSPEVARWMMERARRSRKGRPERVSFPLVRKSAGWGCICPEYYIGLSTGTTQVLPPVVPVLRPM